jgi:hypothetical protein
MKNAQDLLKDLNKGVILTGRLSEVHVKNLQNYPFIFFEGVESVEISYNIITDPNQSLPGVGSVVRFKIKMDKEKNQSIMEKRLDALKNSVKHILWPSVSVIVVDENEKEISVEPRIN